MTGPDLRLARRPDVAAPAGEEGTGRGGWWSTLSVVAASTFALAAMLAAAVWFVDEPAAGRSAVTAEAAPARGVEAYAGLGAWIDVFDFAPEYQRAGTDPPLTPSAVSAMSSHGVSTLYLQAARNDQPATGGVVAPELLGGFLREAHAAGLQVVAWYSPGFSDPAADLQRIEAIHAFNDDGHSFDGVALDIEETAAVTDHEDRTRALMEISDGARAIVGDDALGAIVLPPVLLEEVNPELWGGFPWAELSERYDVFLPMSYWTFRTESSGWRDARRYTTANVERLRDLVGQDTPIHVIGGVGTESREADYRSFTSAVRATAPFGASFFDFLSTSTAGWLELQSVTEGGGAFDPVSSGP
jgi:hypothetical protein